MCEELGITPCKVSLCVREASRQLALLAVISKSKTSGLVLAVCVLRLKQRSRRCSSMVVACLARTKSGIQSSTLGEK